MWPFDRQSFRFGQRRDATGVIAMGMGDEDFLQSDTALPDHGHHPVQMAAGVDDGTAHGFGAP